ncbi:MAG: hypothetical protein L3J74_06145 [Bacteroidales bacterium]|nr:hypothetical protein [Bacteroidales bacterium]
MKTKTNNLIKIQTLIILMVLLSVSFSCTQQKHKNETVFLSENGMLLANKAIEAFDVLNTSLRTQGYDNEMIRILNDPSPATYMMQINTVNSRLVKNNIKKQAAFRLFKKAFSSYNIFLDKNFDYSSSNLQNKIYAAASALDSFKVNDYFLERVQMLKKQVSGTRFNEKTAIMELSLLYADLWNTDLEKLYLLFETDLEAYKKGVNEINNTQFNQQKVASLVDKPYNNSDVLVNLYKLQLVKEKEQKTESLTDLLQNISTGFEYLGNISAEMAKKRQNKEKIHRLNEEFDALFADN